MSAFMGKLCKTITFLSSIKELREAALSYKEAFEPAVKRRLICCDSINQQRTNYANPTTQLVKRSILTAVQNT